MINIIVLVLLFNSVNVLGQIVGGKSSLDTLLSSQQHGLVSGMVPSQKKYYPIEKAEYDALLKTLNLGNTLTLPAQPTTVKALVASIKTIRDDSARDTALRDCLEFFLDLGKEKQVLAAGIKIDQANEYKTTLLIKASFGGVYEKVKKLLAYGAEVNTVDEYGCNPLEAACSSEQVAIARLLLWYGAHVDPKDSCFPLSIAFAKNNRELVSLLIASGACIKKSLFPVDEDKETDVQKAAKRLIPYYEGRASTGIMVSCLAPGVAWMVDKRPVIIDCIQ